VLVLIKMLVSRDDAVRRLASIAGLALVLVGLVLASNMFPLWLQEEVMTLLLMMRRVQVLLVMLVLVLALVLVLILLVPVQTLHRYGHPRTNYTHAQYIHLIGHISL